MAIVLAVIVCATDLGLVLQENGAALFSTFNTAPDSQPELANPTRCRLVPKTDQRQSHTEMIQKFPTTSAIFRRYCY
jgi:hypothetical protein